MKRSMIRSWIAAAAVVVTACQIAPTRMSEDDQAVSETMAGSWDMQFSLDQSPMLTLDATTAPKKIYGKLSLLRNSSLNRSFGRIKVPTNYGSYDVDLTPYGFDPRTPAATPTAVAGRLSRDSVEIILSPESHDERLVMAGYIGAGAITGVWRVSLSSTGGGGTFVMQRAKSKTQ